MSNTDQNQNNNLLQTLHGLIRDWEHEVVEFKQASNSFSQHDIGKYLSAISNEASLKGVRYGWLIFGVNNKTREIVGTNYRDTKGLDVLKHEIAQNSTGGITFIDVFEVYNDENRVVMFKIPAAITGIPTAWKGHWYGRNGESLAALSHEELERLQGQNRYDWSAELIENSSVEHLDSEAIQIARKSYKEKQNRRHISEEIDNMSDDEFLSKLNLVVGGKLTNAAMVLLGNPDYDYLVNTPIRIMWRLFGSDTMVKDYLEFCVPYITVVDQVYSKIRNLTYRYLPDRTTLFPTVTTMYNEDLLKELLNNSIAHMTYTSGGRIYMDEFEDMVVISNPGAFIPGDIRKVLKPDYAAPYYRNRLLAEAMMKFDMIDTVQMGIRKIYNIQRNRFFPMPDYDFATPQKVAVTVYGKVLDKSYTKLLFDRSDIDIDSVYLLDRVQKKLPLEKEQYKQLRQLGVIEGKAPNIYISLGVAEIVEEKTQYTKNKAMDDKYYKDLIIKYLEQFGSGTKADFIELLSSKLSDVLDNTQKGHKVRNLLMEMKRNELIERADNNRRSGVWRLAKED